MKRRILALLTALVLLLSLTACGGEEKNLDDSEPNEQSEDVADVETPEENPEEAEDEAFKFDPGELAYLDKSRDELLEVYNALNDKIFSEETSSYSPEEQRAFEEECVKSVASEYGLTEEDVNKIYYTGSVQNYFATFDVDNVKWTHGELQDIVVWGSEITIKAKIEPLLSNKQTVDQNYFSVCDFIRKYAGIDYTSISYWAVADMTNGSEEKVISFDLSADIIQTIATEQFPDNQLGNYAENLFIHPSLV